MNNKAELRCTIVALTKELEVVRAELELLKRSLSSDWNYEAASEKELKRLKTLYYHQNKERVSAELLAIGQNVNIQSIQSIQSIPWHDVRRITDREFAEKTSR